MEPAEAGVAAQRKLLKLAHQRLERFVTLAPKFLVNDEPDTIHDLRVWSRRLQQTLRSLASQSQPGASRKAGKILRRVRQAVGPLRNLDVNTELVQSRLKAAPSPVLREAWEALKHHLRENRAALLMQARADVAQYDFVAFIERAQKLLQRSDPDADPRVSLEKAVSASWTDWDEAYGLAGENRSVENLHSLRIATKRVRYRAELLADVGSPSLKPMVKDLKAIQSNLGDWHDRSVLSQFLAEFIAQPQFLASHPEMAGALLAHMEEEKQRNEEAIEEILKRMPKPRKRWTDWQEKRSEN